MSYFTENLKNIKEKVTWLLEVKAPLKDDDNRLIANFWLYEAGKENVYSMSGMDLLSKLSKGELTGPETIRRCRQKLQEEKPELRGLSYRSRKKAAVEVRNEI